MSGAGATRLGVISDTHGKLRAEVFTYLAGVDLIVHAGDIGPPGILEDLGVLAPVVAVWGNTDGFDVRRLVPETARQSVGGRQLVVLHGHQFGSPSPETLHQAFPDADLIVYGHTHRPLVTEIDGCTVLNPGSAGDARFGLQPSVAIVQIDEDGTIRVEHIEF
jgi:uncharacterized protein